MTTLPLQSTSECRSAEQCRPVHVPPSPKMMPPPSPPAPPWPASGSFWFVRVLPVAEHAASRQTLDSMQNAAGMNHRRTGTSLCRPSARFFQQTACTRGASRKKRRYVQECQKSTTRTFVVAQGQQSAHIPAAYFAAVMRIGCLDGGTKGAVYLPQESIFPVVSVPPSTSSTYQCPSHCAGLEYVSPP